MTRSLLRDEDADAVRDLEDRIENAHDIDKLGHRLIAGRPFDSMRQPEIDLRFHSLSRRSAWAVCKRAYGSD